MMRLRLTQIAALLSTSSALVAREPRVLRGVLREALEKQERKRDGLARQLASGSDKARASIPPKLAAVDAAEEQLRALLARVDEEPDAVVEAMALIDGLGLAARLESYDPEAAAAAARESCFGRPAGFDGLVIACPRGAPCLVGRRAFGDETLRRVSQGTDLWFQTVEGRGSRVLLRSSLVKSLKRPPRESVEFAADLAAYFSPEYVSWREDPVEVMFTDSRHVAKRGSRVGQMKPKKRLGSVWARPQRVAAAAREAQEAQGWLS